MRGASRMASYLVQTFVDALTATKYALAGSQSPVADASIGADLVTAPSW